MTYRTRNRSTESQEKAAAFRQMAALLDGEIKTGKHTERLERADRPQIEASGLDRYSALNQLLILQQCPHVTEVHGYEEWKKLGFQVRKGEHSIGICAPRTKKEDGEQKVTGFHRASVFDRSQVDPISTDQQPQETEAATGAAE